MEKGTVKWFNNAKGFGFICPEGGGEDIFAHYSTIQMDGYRTLKAGQSVQFDVHQAKRQSRQCYCARRSRSGSRIALLSHCVHPKGKMPARSAGILSQNYSRARASTGSSRAAFRAGNHPNKIPVAVEQRNASSSANGENQSPSRVRKAAR